jgi:hypothetical protein
VIDKIGFRKWALVEIWTDSTGALSRSKNYLKTYKSYEIAYKQLMILGEVFPTKRGGEVSKSELRRIEIVAPEAIKQLREQIAREIEELPYYGTVKEAVENAAAIARGQV